MCGVNCHISRLIQKDNDEMVSTNHSICVLWFRKILFTLGLNWIHLLLFISGNEFARFRHKYKEDDTINLQCIYSSRNSLKRPLTKRCRLTIGYWENINRIFGRTFFLHKKDTSFWGLFGKLRQINMRFQLNINIGLPMSYLLRLKYIIFD